MPSIDDGIGLEGTETEFRELLAQAESLTSEEAVKELIDCSRFGETDAVRAILDKHADSSESSSFVDSTDESGNTSLHNAAANGHKMTCQLLLARGASHLPNSSGNTPLHWAAANGHADVVKLLLSEERFKGMIDVLQKNSFGRSALTEGFSSSNTRLVGSLLEHESAEEERLIGGIQKEDVTNGNDADDVVLNEDGSIRSSDTGSSTKTCVVHEFDFLRVGDEDGSENDINDIDNKIKPQTVFIRELPIAHADDPFGAKPEEDTTGLGIWSASLVCARWMASNEIISQLEGKKIVELGAGCGIPGLSAAIYGKPSSLLLTDLNPVTVRNMQYNIDLNKGHVKGCEPSAWCERVTASTIDWDDEKTWPTEKVDCVIGSDLVYQGSIVPMLRKVIIGILKPKGCFLYVCPEGGRDGLDEFIRTMSGTGFQLTSTREAPQAYRQNPLSNGDEEDCFLHFHELASTTYVLYEFNRCSGGDDGLSGSTCRSCSN